MKPFTISIPLLVRSDKLFAGGLGRFAIGATGYNAADKIQSEAVVQGIHTVATLVPSILFCHLLNSHILLSFNQKTDQSISVQFG